jgi:hypothetical protein
MKRTFLLLAIGTLGACTAVAQTSPSGQAGASAQSQTAVRANNSGAQAAGSGSATSSGSLASTSSSTPAPVNATNNYASISSGTKIDATLATSLDAKRSKPGDDVEARTEEDIKQDGKVVLKKGTHLVGHVTQAQARAKGQTQSELGIVFDHAVLKNGEEVPFSASIQALASGQQAAGSTGADDMMASGGGMGSMRGTARGGGNLVGGVASTTGSTTGAVMNTASSMPVAAGGSLNAVAHSSGAVGGLNSTGRLESSSSGVFGLDGLSLDSAASTATQGSTIVSSTKNVHLDSGTQLLLRTTGQVQ